MVRVDLPDTGFSNADGTLTIARLCVQVGERTSSSSELFVCGYHHSNYITGSVPFAGTLVLREGRSDVDHDVKILGPHRATQVDPLADLISMALDSCASNLVEAEMARICD